MLAWHVETKDSYSYSLYHSNPLIDLYTDRINVLGAKTARDICRFAVLCWVTRLFCRFTRVYEGHFKLCYKEELKVEKSR